MVGIFKLQSFLDNGQILLFQLQFSSEIVDFKRDSKITYCKGSSRHYQCQTSMIRLVEMQRKSEQHSDAAESFIGRCFYNGQTSKRKVFARYAQC